MLDAAIRAGLQTFFGREEDPAYIETIVQCVEDAIEARLISEGILIWAETAGLPVTTQPVADVTPSEALLPTPSVATVDAVDFLPLLAAAAHRLTPITPDLATDETQMGIEVIDAPEHKALRHFIFAIQPMFGVRTRVQVIDGQGQFTVGGIRDDVRQFRVAVEAFVNIAPTAGLDAADAATLWATIGNLAASTPRAQTQTEAAAERYTAASAYLTSRLGPARTLVRATPAVEGRVHDLAVGALADAATRL